MKKKLLLIALVALLLITGCKKETNYALEFKEEYESLNGTVNSSGKEHRSITINENNPYIKTTPSKIVEKINNKDTFILYVGDSLCPWCRSVLEKSIEVAYRNGIEEIYYIDIWDDDGNEILRDKYVLKDGKPVKESDGTQEYYTLLEKFDSVLNDYTLTDDNDNKIEVGEKRIYAPNFFFIKDGKVGKMVSGISEKQTDPRGELTEEILKDEDIQFQSLFELMNLCTEEIGC